MSFGGYLLKSGNSVFPHQYIQLNTWSTTPKQREEIKAYRDDNTRALTRVTASGMKSVIKFKTRPYLHLADKNAIITWFKSRESNQTERKISLTYWDDDSASYSTGDFYRPNMEFTIYKITEDDIIYGEMEFEFVEY